MRALARVVTATGLSPERVIVSHVHDLKSFQPTDARPWGPSFEEMAAAARESFPGAKVGGGMLSYFTELNRKPPPQGVFDFVTHSICPIVHDAGDAAVMQTIECLPDVFASARAIIGKVPYHLGPSTIGARMNPYGAALADNPKGQRMCLAPNDPRQQGTFASAWTLAMLVAATRAGIACVTPAALCGPQGLLTPRGRPTAFFDMLESLMTFGGAKAAALVSGSTAVDGLAIPTRKGLSVWLCNLSDTPQRLVLRQKRVTLPPYDIRRLMFKP